MSKKLVRYKEKIFGILKADYEDLELLKKCLPNKKEKYSDLEEEQIKKYNDFIKFLILKYSKSKTLEIEIELKEF